MRRQLLKRRLAMSDHDWNAANQAIISRLKKLPEIDNNDPVHIYMPIKEKKEIDTFPFVRWLLKLNRTVVVPVTEFETSSLRHVLLRDPDNITTNRWGVPEPLDAVDFPIDEIGLVVVPMLGGDYHKNRLGYGKGFYDRFLKQIPCPTVGLLHHINLVENLPVAEFDVPLGHIVTEKMVL